MRIKQVGGGSGWLAELQKQEQGLGLRRTLLVGTRPWVPDPALGKEKEWVCAFTRCLLIHGERERKTSRHGQRQSPRTGEQGPGCHLRTHALLEAAETHLPALTAARRTPVPNSSLSPGLQGPEPEA